MQVSSRTIVLSLAAAAAIGCAVVALKPPPAQPVPTDGAFLMVPQSWDQETLKRNDRGCPTAIYVAPGGNLEECP